MGCFCLWNDYGALMKKFLDAVNSSDDVKKLNIPELEGLAVEIREFLVDNISKHGGHLSSNLGTVELTLALHKVFDFSSDKIVWDVGHQAYTHKILTGRKAGFEKLRQKDGISGFPKTQESEMDAFNTGHSSTSVSAALGFAKSFELDNSDSRAVAVVGDGAMTGGMVYEALNHVGISRTPLIVIVNDNGMSISENVGSLPKHLRKAASSSGYIGAKKSVKNFLKGIPLIGKPFSNFMRKSKRFLKKILLQKNIFENMGLEYLGPVDGHDLKDLITIIDYAKFLYRPVVVHVLTQKGKGYAPSEKEPTLFHGIGHFDAETGEVQEKASETFSATFGKKIVQMAKENENIVCVTAAMPTGTGLCDFAREFPQRFFDVGIAEQHAVTFSAAMAKSGKVPVFAVYSTFLQRGYDQILHDVALQNLHVVFAIDRAGASGNDGETHQGIYDLSYLSHIPNMTVMAPSSNEELEQMLEFAVNECEGPVAIRYPKGENLCKCQPEILRMGKGVVERDGNDVLIVALGAQVRQAHIAADILAERGISACVMNSRFLKPFDDALLADNAKGKRLVAVSEDNVETGGFAETVRKHYEGRLLTFAFADKPLSHATVEEQKKMAGIDGVSMAEKIISELDR